ncbi:glycosyl transferase group 1 [Chlorobaculum parvum NCIB 8327]|uniref:Glycosyl transferase group 1 n=1 Tax=Chlorobaculum parvum (strain DSM 263 / NCIMB 8327) TaxID=517417 RepID=B3QPI8_CHLP8|nr:N-acetyl-alpha-D-glucosaminyl L-malate synthase BshA [Chlorobaculum parvum]ACF11841.1 glycosyl transferase group 1 [Chlorobaculum parvum NCIB 8327]
MKIGISCHHTYGGSGAVATELGKALATKGHTVHFFSQAAPFRLGLYSKNIFCHEVEAMHYPLFESPFYSLALASKIAEVAYYEELDVVHAHYAIPHAISAVLARQMLEERCPESQCFRIATTLHGTDITIVGADKSMKDAVRLAINKSDGISAVSGYLRDETIKMFDPRKPIEVIHNFVDTALFKRLDDNRPKQMLGLDGGKVVIHISNFRPVKRIMDVLAVFERIQRDVEATLLLVGDGPDRSEAETWVRRNGLGSKVRFLGKLDDIVPLLSIADLMLMPSNVESFGLAALEAMACGVPVVVTDAGGFPEFVRQGIDGYLHDHGDIEGMSRSAISILKDDAVWQRFSDAAVNQAGRFETALKVQEYEAFYRRLIDEARERKAQ